MCVLVTRCSGARVRACLNGGCGGGLGPAGPGGEAEGFWKRRGRWTPNPIPNPNPMNCEVRQVRRLYRPAQKAAAGAETTACHVTILYFYQKIYTFRAEVKAFPVGNFAVAQDAAAETPSLVGF